jgi:hypothetical protein
MSHGTPSRSGQLGAFWPPAQSASAARTVLGWDAIDELAPLAGIEQASCRSEVDPEIRTGG